MVFHIAVCSTDAALRSGLERQCMEYFARRQDACIVQQLPDTDALLRRDAEGERFGERMREKDMEAERVRAEAARLDGCGTIGIICRISAPMNRAGMVCTLLLSFLDGWNMVEQPMVYLENFGRYPISVALASVPPEDPTVQLVCCILTVLPPLFLFTYFNRELVEGIALGGEK